VPYSSKITGYGFAFESNDDASGPTSNAISRSMKIAIDRAQISPSEIDVVIANGDGTVRGDKNEIEAIHQVFSNSVHEVKVFSSKGALGHLLAGAPAIDIILGITILQSGIIPATLNTHPQDKDIRFNLLSENLSDTNPRKIMVNCQSLEGQSVSLIIESVD
jgi:3-oxoacyl-[acyl-carrier-protein] synthase II